MIILNENGLFSALKMYYDSEYYNAVTISVKIKRT